MLEQFTDTQNNFEIQASYLTSTDCGEVDPTIKFGSEGTHTQQYYITMYYRSHDSHAGWGYIKVSDLPDDGVAGVIKEVLKDAGKTELEFECEGKSVNCDCGDALPLIKYGEGSRTVCVELRV